MDKEQLRGELQKCLRVIPPEQRSEKSHRICRNLVSTAQFQGASLVMMYLPLAYEVDTSEVILQAWQSGKSVSVPRISWQQRHMIAVEINSLETGLSTSAFGLRSPVTGVPVPFEEIDLVVVPALGFDRKGNRLGRGSSYYDRFFTDNELRACKSGLAFAEQVVDSIPAESTDVPVDFLVTDEEVMYFNDQKGE